jgi:hypothetical protein
MECSQNKCLHGMKAHLFGPCISRMCFSLAITLYNKLPFCELKTFHLDHPFFINKNFPQKEIKN